MTGTPAYLARSASILIRAITASASKGCGSGSNKPRCTSIISRADFIDNESGMRKTNANPLAGRDNSGLQVFLSRHHTLQRPLCIDYAQVKQCNNVLLEILQLDKTLFTSSRSLDTNNYESNGLCWSCAIGMSISGKCLSAGMFPSTISDVYRKQQTRKNEEKLSICPRKRLSSSYNLVINWLVLIPSRWAMSCSVFQNIVSKRIEVTTPCKRKERAFDSYKPGSAFTKISHIMSPVDQRCFIGKVFT